MPEKLRKMEEKPFHIKKSKPSKTWIKSSYSLATAEYYIYLLNYFLFVVHVLLTLFVDNLQIISSCFGIFLVNFKIFVVI